MSCKIAHIGHGVVDSSKGVNVRVVQSVFGKFHHFDLARELHRRGMLEVIFSTYPRWKLRDERLPGEKIRTFPWFHTPLLAKWRCGLVHPRFDADLAWAMAETFDDHVARRLPACDVYIAISGSGLKTSRVVKERGGRYVCDRGSTHIRFAERILHEEFERWGQRFPGIDPRCVAKEEAEYETADVITLPSSFTVSTYLKMGVDPNKLRRIPYGVDLSRFEKTTHPASDSFEVLFVGQVSFRKGIPYLLSAFARVKHPRKRLRVVGAMQEEIKRFLGGRTWRDVEFVGSIEQRRLKDIMSASHVMVLPSVEDGLGLVLGQAMACGCPVICTTHTGGEDLLSDGVEGFIVPPRDEAALAERLQQMADDRELRNRMGEAALRRVRHLRGWDDYGSRFADLCRHLASGWHGRREKAELVGL